MCFPANRYFSAQPQPSTVEIAAWRGSHVIPFGAHLRTVRLAITTVALMTVQSALAPPTAQFNPKPALLHELIATIKDAPGPFDEVTGYVMYQVTNTDCLPLQRGSGATLAMQKRLPLELKLHPNGYMANFYLDPRGRNQYSAPPSFTSQRWCVFSAGSASELVPCNN
jgi:hypothetical protein